MLVSLALVLFGYLLGSVSSAVIVCRVMGHADPRNAGSGNPGATNVLRLYGKAAAIFTLAGDVLKGVLPVICTRVLEAADPIIALTALAAFCGHLYPLYFHFRGGKGVATLVGVLSAAHWLLGLGFIATWLAMALLFRYSSLAAITAACLTPLYTWAIHPAPSWLACFSLMTVVLLWRHRNNIRHLREGTEDKIGSR